MKNRKAKLTALVLSALMAMSTISSVTWATDMFTDSTTDQLSTQTLPEFSSDNVEISEEDEAESLPTITAPLHSSTVDQDGEGYTVAVVAGQIIRFDLYGVSYANTIEIQYKAYDEINSPDEWKTWTGTDGTTTTATCEVGKLEPSDCLHPERNYCEFSYGGETFFAYKRCEDLSTWKNKGVEKHNFKTYPIPIVTGDCEQKGVSFSYRQCVTCKAVYDYETKGVWTCSDTAYSENPQGWFDLKFGKNSTLSPKLDAEDIKAHIKSEGEEYLKKVYDAVEKAIKSSDASIFQVEYLEGYGHTIDPALTVYSNTPPKDSVYWDDNVTDWTERNNCTVTSAGVVTGPLDPSKPAIYYKIETCSTCKKQITTEIKFHNPDVVEGDEFIKAGVNVKGFVHIDDKGNMIEYKDSKGNYFQQIPSNWKYLIIRVNCNANASIVHVTKLYGDNGNVQWIEGETEWLGSGHTWKGASCKAWPGSEATDFQSLPTNVIYDADDLPNVYAKDCITEAYYSFEEVCYSCGEQSNRSGVKMKAKPGPHKFDESTRVTDYSLTKYTEIDDQHHLEKYTDVINCGLCGEKQEVKSKKGDAIVDHKLIPLEVDGTKIEPKCGETGSYIVKDKCICGYVDNDSEKTVVLPATDKHEWESTTPFLEWSGQVFIDNVNYGNATPDILNRTFHVDVVRKCKICGLTDSNGINGTIPQSKPDGDLGNNYNRNNNDKNHYDDETKVPGGKWCAEIHVDRDTIVDAKKDPSTGVPYPCSTAHATIYVDWVGMVDGNLVTLNADTTQDAVKENVPYYGSVEEYTARTAHTPGAPHKEGDNIVKRCTVCGDIVSTEPDNTPSVDVPTVSASSVDFDTINVSWTKVDGATAYRLYYRSSDEGISKWTKIRTFTGDTTSYQVNGLTTGSRYRFTVRAEVTQDGKTTLGDYSRKGAVAVPKLTAPEIKSVTASGKTMKVTWSRVDGASGYIVFRNSQRVGTVTKGSKVTWTDKKPVSGAKYQIRAYRTEDKKNYKSDLSVAK